MSTRVEGLNHLRERVMGRLPEAMKAEIKKANDKNADEFMGLVRKIIPRGNPSDGNLVDTLAKEDAKGSETGVAVTIGGSGQPHPMHLEGGHRAPDGTHVPGKPYWNPSKRVLAKKAKGRASRAANKAIKAMAAGT